MPGKPYRIRATSRNTRERFWVKVFGAVARFATRDSAERHVASLRLYSRETMEYEVIRDAENKVANVLAS